jgi:hypothetical protein
MLRLLFRNGKDISEWDPIIIFKTKPIVLIINGAFEFPLPLNIPVMVMVMNWKIIPHDMIVR